MDFSQFKCLSFDCYGTLVDWETGLLNALRPVLSRANVSVSDEILLEHYGAAESSVESDEFCRYREVLRRVLVRLGSVFGFAPTPEEKEAFAASVGDWPVFEDSQAALQRLSKRFRLIILSNIDDDLFRGSERRLGVAFDHVFTAEQIGDYKPSRTNFEYLLAHSGVEAHEILHVAQSLYHDIDPANRLGLSTVWVNRRHDREGGGATPASTAKPDLEVPNLATLASMIFDE